MPSKFNNDWLIDSIKRGSKLEDDDYRGFDLLDDAAEASDEILESIAQFEGTKVIISCTPDIALFDLVKRALCFADLVIVTPAPLWISDDFLTLKPYREFNLDSYSNMRKSSLIPCWTSSRLFSKIAALIYSD